MEEYTVSRHAGLGTILLSVVLTACGTRDKDDASSEMRAAATPGVGSLVGVQSTTDPRASGEGMAGSDSGSGSASAQQEARNPEGAANPVALEVGGAGSGGTGNAPP